MGCLHPRWPPPTGLDAVEWAERAAELGAGEILVTSMDRDGTRDGYDVELLEAIGAAVNIPVIASGGAGSLSHFADALAPGRADAVLAASMFHFGEFRIADLKQYLADQHIPVQTDDMTDLPVKFDGDGLDSGRHPGRFHGRCADARLS